MPVPHGPRRPAPAPIWPQSLPPAEHHVTRVLFTVSTQGPIPERSRIGQRESTLLIFSWIRAHGPLVLIKLTQSKMRSPARCRRSRPDHATHCCTIVIKLPLTIWGKQLICTHNHVIFMQWCSKSLWQGTPTPLALKCGTKTVRWRTNCSWHSVKVTTDAQEVFVF